LIFPLDRCFAGGVSRDPREGEEGMIAVNQERMTTADLFRSASLLCQGAKLERLERTERGIVFVLTGVGITDADAEYRTGKARVNPLELKLHLNHLRDQMFGNERGREARDDRGSRTPGR
jgi:hypothetical protein